MGWLSDNSGGLLSLIGGNINNKANAKQAKLNRQWQERMSNSAHQRQVKDLRAAGLNPILSAGGSGASSPGGAQATMQDIITPSISTAMQYKRLQADIKNIDANTNFTNAKTGVIKPASNFGNDVSDVWDGTKSFISNESNGVTNLIGEAINSTAKSFSSKKRQAVNAVEKYINEKSSQFKKSYRL